MNKSKWSVVYIIQILINRWKTEREFTRANNFGELMGKFSVTNALPKKICQFKKVLVPELYDKQFFITFIKSLGVNHF